MTNDHTRTDELREAERRLQAAQLADGRTAVSWFLGTLAGIFDGTPFAARLRYTRTWIYDDNHGWRVVAAHVSPARRPSSARHDVDPQPPRAADCTKSTNAVSVHDCPFAVV